MFLAQPLPDDLLHLLVEGEWVLAAPPRADDAGGASTPTRHRFDEGMDVWITRDTGVACAPLEAVAKNLERRKATVERSNVGGYHSHTDLFDAFPRATYAARCAAETAAAAMGADITAQTPATSVSVEGARLVVDDGGGDYQLTVRAGAGGLELAGASRQNDADVSGSIEAWVNVSRAGHFNALHDHAGAAVSGVLFVRAPPAPPGVEFSGCLFLALRFPLGGAPGAYALVAPADRALVAFPGRLAHAVLPLAPEALRDPDDVRISLAFNYP